MQIPSGITFTIDQLGQGLERAQAAITALQNRNAELEQEIATLRQQQTPEETP